MDRSSLLFKSFLVKALLSAGLLMQCLGHSSGYASEGVQADSPCLFGEKVCPGMPLIVRTPLEFPGGLPSEFRYPSSAAPTFVATYEGLNPNGSVRVSYRSTYENVSMDVAKQHLADPDGIYEGVAVGVCGSCDDLKRESYESALQKCLKDDPNAECLIRREKLDLMRTTPYWPLVLLDEYRATTQVVRFRN